MPIPVLLEPLTGAVVHLTHCASIHRRSKVAMLQISRLPNQQIEPALCRIKTDAADSLAFE